MKKFLHIYLSDENTGELIILRAKNPLGFYRTIATAIQMMTRRYYKMSFQKVTFENDKWGEFGGRK